VGVAINLGSGQRPFGKPWINVDCQEKWKPDVVANGASMPMFADGSAEMVVAHQMIEHVGLGEFDGVIREAHRVLAPGGSLILTTPNLRELVKAWTCGRITDYIFGVNLYGAYMNDEADRHRWLYTRETLAQALKNAASWRAVSMFDFRKLPEADIAQDWWILGVEGIK
jgi:predicted SAM-dependent methyltransferase